VAVWALRASLCIMYDIGLELVDGPQAACRDVAG
jgi:hypothetical protein